MSRRLLLAAAVGILAGPVAAQISVTSRAAIDGSYGLEIQTDGSGRAMYAITNKAALYPSLDVQWSMRVTDLQMVLDQFMDVLQVRAAQDQIVFALAVRQVAAADFEVAGRFLDGGLEQWTAPSPLADTSTLHIKWGAGVLDGYFELYVDGVLVGEARNIAANVAVRNLHFGAPAGTVPMQSGYLALDKLQVDSAQQNTGVEVTMQATADEPGHGDISEYIVWSSDVDGFLGVGGGPFGVRLSDGIHTISASAVLSSGDNVDDNVTITVEVP